MPATTHHLTPEAAWEAGYGVIRHSQQTRRRVHEMVRALREEGVAGDGANPYEALHAADRVASAAMWLVVHETYARNVYLDGRPLQPADFKPTPEGHTGGSLNMVPAYTGYMAANALTGVTRSWVMGQGHTVSGIDSVNLLLDNMTPRHAERYGLSDEGLTRYVRDFYSYALGADGRQDSPLGSHVNAHTAGSMVEGGYLGFTELQYVHMPLKGERLVAFLSDGAFEEQRGSDWAPRWWRDEDSGLVMPIMINNGRRIDQRTTASQSGGVAWLVHHLRLNSFNPIVFDGRDPAAFAWAVFEMERRLQAAATAVRSGFARYPVSLPYGIAVAPKGAGFPGEGTNLAHNLPLPGNPSVDPESAAAFNAGARRLWVPVSDLLAASKRLQAHATSGRLRERDHPLAHRDVRLARVPEPRFRPSPLPLSQRERGWIAGGETGVRASGSPTGGEVPFSIAPLPFREGVRGLGGGSGSPMEAVDTGFLRTVQANPHLRPRVGNPDELRSNRMLRTLEALKFRVTEPEAGLPETLDGAIITALNEEAVACAALANKGGINIIVTYEAFGTKMHGVVRQEVIFANHCAEAGRPQGWLSIPLVLTSHTWENGKNEQSHQDPSMAALMLDEPSNVSRVVFAADHNTAAAIMHAVYQTQGQIWTLVVPKASSIPDLLTGDESLALMRDGAARLSWAEHRPGQAKAGLIAIGAYQLVEVLKASKRLRERDVAHSVTYVLEPGRFHAPRSAGEEAHLAPAAVRDSLLPDQAEAAVYVTHTRAEDVMARMGPVHERVRVAGLGFINQGGTLDTPGMLWVNRCSWAHCVNEVARLISIPRESLLTAPELEALDGRRSPQGVVW